MVLNIFQSQLIKSAKQTDRKFPERGFRGVCALLPTRSGERFLVERADDGSCFPDESVKGTVLAALCLSGRSVRHFLHFRGRGRPALHRNHRQLFFLARFRSGQVV